jgi:hypothetical protein
MGGGPTQWWVGQKSAEEGGRWVSGRRGPLRKRGGGPVVGGAMRKGGGGKVVGGSLRKVGRGPLVGEPAEEAGRWVNGGWAR